MKNKIIILLLFCSCTTSDIKNELVQNQSDSLQLKDMLVYIDNENNTLKVHFSKNHIYDFLDFTSLSADRSMPLELEKEEQSDDFNLVYVCNGKLTRLPIKYEQVMNVCGSAAISGSVQTVTPKEVLSYELLETVKVIQLKE